MTHTKPS